MELEELKKSWNALDEHLKDKELIKEDELERLRLERRHRRFTENRSISEG